MAVKLISLTNPLVEGINNAEELIVYCARVSNPSNQLNVETSPKLIRYCIEHGHWSIFEQASMCVEIKTSRAIAAQIIIHKSFSVQEFSKRY
jgi:thymidylate synthase (FAD)